MFYQNIKKIKVLTIWSFGIQTLEFLFGKKLANDVTWLKFPFHLPFQMAKLHTQKPAKARIQTERLTSYSMRTASAMGCRPRRQLAISKLTNHIMAVVYRMHQFHLHPRFHHSFKAVQHCCNSSTCTSSSNRNNFNNNFRLSRFIRQCLRHSPNLRSYSYHVLCRRPTSHLLHSLKPLQYLHPRPRTAYVA